MGFERFEKFENNEVCKTDGENEQKDGNLEKFEKYV